MKIIFDLLTSPLELPIAWFLEYLIIWAISGIAYRVAFALVGNLYDSHLILAAYLEAFATGLLDLSFCFALGYNIWNYCSS